MNREVMARMISATVDAAIRRVPVPTWRPGTVAAVGSVSDCSVVVDGDTDATAMHPGGHPLVVGDRVMVLFYPPRGVMVAARLGHAGDSDLVLLGTVAAPAGAGSPGPPLVIPSSMLPAGYEAIRLVCRLRGNRASTTDQFYLRLNGDTTAANYDRHTITNGSAAFAGATVATLIGDMTAASSVAGVYGRTTITLPGYDSTTQPKQAHSSSMVALSRAAMQQRTVINAWYQNAAITQIELVPANGNINAGEVHVYGMRRDSMIW